MYQPSSIVHGALNVSVATAWPYGSAVTVTVAAAAAPSGAPAAAPIDLALRMPAWAAAPAIPVALNGAPAAYTGTPGTYLHITRAWGASDTLAFDLPMALAAHPYTGVTQAPPLVRYSYTYGPVLLASTGAWDAARHVEYLGPGLDGAAPAQWAAPVPGQPLHWTVAGLPGALLQPAWEVDEGRNFSAVPALDR
jgi:DUF1680 family protein